MQAQYKTYDSYKDSGTPWLGAVPSHWELLRNKHFLNEKKESVGLKAQEFKLLSLTLQGVIARDMENPKGKFPAEFNTYKKVSTNDLVFCLFDVEETPRAVGHSSQDGMITGAYDIYQCRADANPKYIYYYYLSLDEKKSLRSLYTGLRNVIKRDTFLSIYSPIPPSEEQDRIVAFLDYKTEEIESAIEKKQRLIELLKEQKSILINQAVTKGLKSNAPMKDSGIAWIGAIPTNWGVRKLKYVAPNKTTPATKEHKHLAYIGLENIQSFSANYSYSAASEWEGTSKVFKKGDVLFSKLRPYLAKGFIAQENGVCTGELLTLHASDNCKKEFLIELLLCSDFITLINSSTYGSKMPRASWDFIGNQYVPLPSEIEQVAIYEFSKQIKEQTEILIRQESSAIKKLEEFKQTLIAHAVTGKIKV
jgi:type I restriction enzyme, S subunit